MNRPAPATAFQAAMQNSNRGPALVSKILTYGATALLLILAILYAYAHKHELAVLRELRPTHLLGLVAGMVAWLHCSPNVAAGWPMPLSTKFSV